jgi:hypothetical protein
MDLGELSGPRFLGDLGNGLVHVARHRGLLRDVLLSLRAPV